MSSHLSVSDEAEITALYCSGISVKQITVLYHKSHQTIYNAVNNTLIYKRPRQRTGHEIIYPNIDAWLLKHSMSIRKFSQLVGMDYGALRKVLIGGNNPKPETREKIIATTGLAPELAFDTYY